MMSQADRLRRDVGRRMAVVDSLKRRPPHADPATELAEHRRIEKLEMDAATVALQLWCAEEAERKAWRSAMRAMVCAHG